MTKTQKKGPMVNRSVRRILTVMEAIVRHSGRISARDLAARIGYPYTTVVADLKSLQGLGYVSFDPDSRTYAPTLRITLLAGSFTQSARVAEELQAAVDRLAALTRETCILWQNVGDQMQIMYVALGQEPLRMVLEPGMTYSVEGSASGRAWAMVNTRKSEQVAPSEKISREALEVQRARRRGYATAYDELVPHVGSIAVPLVIDAEGPTGGCAFVISVGGVAPNIRKRETELAEILRNTVEKLQRRYLAIIERETAR
jgi:DNA-binding IclR family transcriptional regulator